jgi:hypothetical protein
VFSAYRTGFSTRQADSAKFPPSGGVGPVVLDGADLAAFVERMRDVGLLDTHRAGHPSLTTHHPGQHNGPPLKCTGSIPNSRNPPSNKTVDQIFASRRTIDQ